MPHTSKTESVYYTVCMYENKANIDFEEGWWKWDLTNKSDITYTVDTTSVAVPSTSISLSADPAFLALFFQGGP